MTTDEFIPVASFGSELEAETAGHTLDQLEIPFYIKGGETIFGQGALAAATDGVSLWVPAARADEVRELLQAEQTPVPEQETEDAAAGSEPAE